MRLKVLLTLLGCVFLAWTASAQSPEDRILSAEMDYQLGRFEACRDSARRILFLENDPIYRWQALRLKALSELSLNLTDTSRRSTIQMLKLNPRYRASSYKDPEAWKILLNEVRPFPLLSLGLYFSPQTAFCQTIIKQNFSVEPGTEDYQTDPSTFFGFQVEARPIRPLSLIIGLSAQQLNWSSTQVTSAREFRQRNHEAWYAELPLTLRYYFNPKSKIQIFADAGYALHFSLSQKSSIYLFTDNQIQTKLEQEDFFAYRATQFSSVSGALGIGTELGPGSLSLLFKIQEGITLINDPETRFKNSRIRDEFRYVEDDFRLRFYMIQLAYQLPLVYQSVRK